MWIDLFCGIPLAYSREKFYKDLKKKPYIFYFIYVSEYIYTGLVPGEKNI